MPTTTRKLKVTLEGTSGTINKFLAFVDGRMILNANGGAKKTVPVDIKNTQVRLKVRVTGINDAKYKLTIDLPGTADDQTLEFQLTGGYHETEITL